MKIRFPKRYNSPEDLAELLSQRGLAFDDKERVCRYICNIGYYRLSAYFYPFLEIPKDRQIFKQGSSFDAAIKLYRFDKKLRLFMMRLRRLRFPCAALWPMSWRKKPETSFG